MNKKLIITGGIINILLGLFHFCFWNLFDWATNTACLLPPTRATLYILNIHIGYTVFAFGYLSLLHHREMTATRIGKTVLAVISIFYIIRAADQFIFYCFEPAALVPSILFAIFLTAVASLYFIPLLRKER